MSENTWNKHFRSNGWETTAHGLRSTFRDWCAETKACDDKLAELCIQHETAKGNKVARAYHRSDMLDARRDVMTKWANFVTSKAHRQKHKLKRDRIADCEKAAAGCAEIVSLGELAQAQVEELRLQLEERTNHWRGRVYQNATTFAPVLTSTEMDAKGALGLKVGRSGVEGPAQHLSNASALRGSLLGFFLAFREHVLSLRGGLRLLVFDDPQELLDNDNRARLARGLTELANEDAQILATTHDKHFAREFVQENRGRRQVTHL